MTNVSDNPLISVIIPVYNTEKYLDRCLDSVLGNTYKNIEVILVDDGSTDNSGKICDEYALIDSRVRVFHKENGGPSETRNIGIKNASGEYIMFSDSDDTVDPKWCEYMIDAIINNPNSWVVCNIQVLSEEKDYTMKMNSDKVKYDKDEYFTFYSTGLSGSVYNKIFNTKIVLDNNILFDESRIRGEDVKFNLDYLDKCMDILLVNESLYHYYCYTSSVTLTNTYHKDDFILQKDLYCYRIPYISERYIQEFKKNYWNKFNIELDRTMSLNKEDSFFSKIKLNNASISTSEYQNLLRCFGKNEMNNIAFCFLKNNNYFGYWIVDKISNLKRKIFFWKY